MNGRSTPESRHHQLKYKFDLTLDDYTELLASQGGVCAICGQTDDDRWMPVDHDHLTGQIRGILCTPCNNGLGLFKDDLPRLKAAIAYLEWHSVNPTGLVVPIKGLGSPRGEQHKACKLSEQDVRDIRRRAHAGEDLKLMSSEYGLTFSGVHAAATGITWAWLQDAPIFPSKKIKSTKAEPNEQGVQGG